MKSTVSIVKVLTTVRVYGVATNESLVKVEKYCWFVQVTERCEVVLTDQYLGIPQRREVILRGQLQRDFL